MSRQTASKLPAPDAYDHLWSLLPVFVTFLVVIVIAAATYEHPLQVGKFLDPEAQQTGLYPPASTDASVPAAEAAMARLPDAVAEPVATF